MLPKNNTELRYLVFTVLSIAVPFAGLYLLSLLSPIIFPYTIFPTMTVQVALALSGSLIWWIAYGFWCYVYAIFAMAIRTYPTLKLFAFEFKGAFIKYKKTVIIGHIFHLGFLYLSPYFRPDRDTNKLYNPMINYDLDSGLLSLNTQITLITVVTLFISFVINELIERHKFDLFTELDRRVSGFPVSESTPESSQLFHRTSTRDIAVTCAHEAGHALLFAALPKVSDQFIIKVLETPDNGTLGYVGGYSLGDEYLPTKCFMEWSMLMLLSGRAAEQATFGVTTFGAGADYKKWQLYARLYLGSGYGRWLDYNCEAKTQEEHVANSVVVNALLDSQIDWLLKLFEVNREVLMDLAAMLRERRTLNKSDTEPFWARVMLPEDCPRPADVNFKGEEPSLTT